MAFIAHTDEDRQQMLAALGLSSMEELFAHIPQQLRGAPLQLPPGRSELEVWDEVSGLSRRNATDLVNFVGAGFYDHYIPAAVNAIISRGEFATAYTPYQPEVSQGTLQALFEYQSAICRLTEMEVANASLYDGGTALYEAMMMAIRITGRRKVLVDDALSPIYRRMLDCYTRNLQIEFHQLRTLHGRTDRDAFEDLIDDQTAAVLLQNPNFFGVIDDFSDIVTRTQERGALAVMSAYPIALGLIKTPGAMGADIVTGEGQSLGLPLSFGGPYVGFMATRHKHVRKMPGRICGETVDATGRRGFVLTLQAREQHIRRDKATSNICTNQTLCAMATLVYLCLLGKQGLVDVARLCADKAAYAKQRLAAIPGVTVKTSSPTFNEFTVHLPREAGDVIGRLIDKRLAPGFPLGRYYPGMDHYLLVAVTEKRTKEQIGLLAEGLEAVL